MSQHVLWIYPVDDFEIEKPPWKRRPDECMFYFEKTHLHLNIYLVLLSMYLSYNGYFRPILKDAVDTLFLLLLEVTVMVQIHHICAGNP